MTDGNLSGFLVVSDAPEKAAEALRAAAVRFCTVDQNGKELTREEMTGECPQYMPNYVSDVHLTDLGPMILTDTKGELPKGMGEGMLRILVAELQAQEIAALVTTPPVDFALEDVPRIVL
ncbi:hypothetical protein AB0N24_00940 [Arthrobacter sp. NPDC093128]|uniref:hypothetical protein n=1 Tax=Arthrobacter sp. NPDC093128 TaxID=3154979 RepID=UPI00341F84A1